MSDSANKDKKKKRRPRNPEHERKEGAFTVVVRNLSLALTYRRLAFAALMSFIAMIVCLVSMLLVTGKPVPPQYIPVTEDGRLLPLVPLNQPSVDDGTIGQFALNTVRELNNYDYMSWRDQTLVAQPRFLPSAWNEYRKAFDQSNIIKTVTDRKMIVIGRPTGNVEIENKGISDGVFTWRVAVPLEIQYVAHADATASQGPGALSARRRATLYIQRVPPTVSPGGIAVRVYQEEDVRPGPGN